LTFALHLLSFRADVIMLHTMVLFAALLSPAQAEPTVEADFVLINATLFDGGDQPGQFADLAIQGDRIVAVGKFKWKGQPRVLDCKGLVLAPGFIDLHTHSDNAMTSPKTAPNLNYLTQGVTTIVTGNCGSGPVDAAAYFGKMEKQGIGSNVIHQVPHNSVCAHVMGNANRAPTDKELKQMEDLVDQGMRDGAWGLATGLIYNPGTYSKTDELIALAKVAAKHDGFYASHIRDEGTAILSAIDEILTIARKAGIRVHVSHIKVSGRRSWGKAADVIAVLRKARSEGLAVTADQYPYIASSTSLAAMVIPAKYREGKADEFFERLADPELGPKLRKDIEDRIDGRQGGSSLKIASYSPRTDWQGKDLATIAEMEKKPILEIVLDIQRKGGASVVSFGMNEEDVRMFMKEPWVATASDGSSMLPAKTVPHPRSYGTFSRKIGRYAIEDKVVPLEQAIRSASGLPADILKLPRRGYLKVGYFADVVVLDPKAFRDKATFEQPHQYSSGVRFLFVNGRLAIDDARPTEVLAGRVLRHTKKEGN
jgi:N-acyl-D-amino-acid deacylase